jgi:hypothetical protein
MAILPERGRTMSHNLMMQLGMMNQSNDRTTVDCQSSELDVLEAYAFEDVANDAELMQTVEYKVLMCDIPTNPLFIN